MRTEKASASQLGVAVHVACAEARRRGLPFGPVTDVDEIRKIARVATGGVPISQRPRTTMTMQVMTAVGCYLRRCPLPPHLRFEGSEVAFSGGRFDIVHSAPGVLVVDELKTGYASPRWEEQARDYLVAARESVKGTRVAIRLLDSFMPRQSKVLQWDDGPVWTPGVTVWGL